MAVGEPRFGLGLSARGHARMVVIYAAVLLALAAFGMGRLREYVPRVLAAIHAAQHRQAVYAASRRAFATALRGAAAAPRPNPVLPHRPPPYPILALRRHEEGDVLLKLLVLPDGSVGDARLLRSSGSAQLDAAALTGVGGWAYLPAIRDHHAVAAWTKVRMRFHPGPAPAGQGPAPGGIQRLVRAPGP